MQIVKQQGLGRQAHLILRCLFLSLLGHLALFACFPAHRPARPAWPQAPQGNMTLELMLSPVAPVSPPPSAPIASPVHQRPAAKPAARLPHNAVQRHSVRTPVEKAVGAEPQQPAVDLSAAAIREAAGSVVREQNNATERKKQGSLPAATSAPKKNRLQKSIEHSVRPDCWHRYSGMGLLAVVPLLKDGVTDSGCQW